jgi:hypothetical protein
LNLRRSRPGTRQIRASIVVSVLAALLGMTTAAGAAANPANTAATHAYLAAEYVYRQALAAELPQSTAAVEAQASRLAGECPGVLSGAPKLEFGEQSSQRPGELRERLRERRQLGHLVSELGIALYSAFEQPQQAAVAAFSATVATLRWSSAAVTRGVRAYAALIADPTEAQAPDVCADMRAWVISGYKLLSAASKAFIARQESRFESLLAPIATIVTPTSSLLRRYEGPAEKALVRRIQTLERRPATLQAPFEAALERLRTALGVPTLGFEGPETPAKDWIVIGRGRTAAGETFVAKLQPPSPSARNLCQLSVTIESGNSGLGACLSRGQKAAEPSVNCDEGRLTIQSLTRARTRSVSLLLSDGRRITSRALIVPARLGGPAGIYYQAVRGPSPIPVSITELDAHGRTQRVVRLPAIVECTEHPVKYFPGGIRTLVRGTVPGGRRFTIVGEHYRFLGHVYFDLKVHTPEGRGGGGVSFSSGSGGPPVFSPEERSGCTPRPYDIIYGVLKDPRDTVLVRTGGKLSALRKVHIPASLHAEGVLVYGAFPAPPEEVIVRGAHGKKLLDESRRESFARERCEGESEGASTAAAHRSS